MSEYQKQKSEKPPIDSLICLIPAGELRCAMEDLIAFLRENGMSPQWSAVNSYKFSSRDRRVAIVKLFPGSVEVRANLQYGEELNACLASAPEEEKSLVLEQITRCYGCGTCKPGLNVDILGRYVNCACLNPVVCLKNPSAAGFSLAKKLILLRKDMIARGLAPRVTYIAKSKRK